MQPIRTITVSCITAALALGAVAFAATTTHTTTTTRRTATAKSAKPAAGGASTAKLIERGKYLATVANCNDCHTPGTLFGAPDFSRQLSGSELGWNGPWGTSYARNLTPDMETGLGYYSAQDIVNAIKSGHRLDGKPMLPPMPWQDYQAFPAQDLLAIATFLKSLPPIVHKAPEVLPPGQMPTSGAYVSFPAPPSWDAPHTASGDSTGKH